LAKGCTLVEMTRLENLNPKILETHLMANPEDDPQKNLPDGIFFNGFPGEKVKEYPAWRYHEWLEPVMVHGTKEDEKVQRQGWMKHNKPVTAVRYLLNQRFDLEDMSARQLAQYARDEYGVDLPVEAGKEKLFKSIWRLSMNAPENEGRVVMMANAIEMNYDETQSEIRRLVKKGEGEITVEEFWA
jgi:hypothetical protein